MEQGHEMPHCTHWSRPCRCQMNSSSIKQVPEASGGTKLSLQRCDIDLDDIEINAGVVLNKS